MVKLRKTILVISVLYLCAHSIPAPGQTLPKSQERRMNAMVIDAIMRLDECSDIDSRQKMKEYVSMFESGETGIFCDLYSSEDFLEQIPVQAYAESFLDDSGNAPGLTAFTYGFRNVKKKSWSYEDGKWLCVVGLEKSLNYFDEHLVYYPVAGQNKNNGNFVLEISFIFNEECSGCKISGIRCLNTRDFENLGGHYYVIQKNADPVDAKRDEGIMVDRRHVVFNEFGQGFSPHLNMSFWDDDVKVTAVTKEQTPRYDYVQFKYKPRHMRLRLRNEFSPISAYSTAGNTALAENSSFSYTAGLDFGYSAPVSRGFKIGFYTGIGISFSRISLKSLPLNYSYTVSDHNGNDYDRIYNLESISQSAKFRDLAVPLYISPEFRLARAVSIVADLGVKAYFNTNAVSDPFHVTGTVTGRYEDMPFIPGGEYATGRIDSDINEYVSAISFRRKPVDLVLSGSMGIDVNLSRNTLYLQIRAGYDYGLTWTYQASNDVFYNPSDGIYPLVYHKEIDRNVVFRSLSDCISFRRQSFCFGFGLMLKL